jgi:hypothetical protein
MSVSPIGPSNATAQMLAATQSEARPHLGLFHFKDGPKHSQLGSRAGYIDAKLCSPDCHDAGRTPTPRLRTAIMETIVLKLVANSNPLTSGGSRSARLSFHGGRLKLSDN